MSTETDREEPVAPERRSRTVVAMGRRRLLRGGLSAAPVIMTVASGPVSAGLCTTGSAFGSFRPSGKQLGVTCSGRSPAVWDSNPGQWPLNQNTLFQAYFTPALTGTNVSFKDVLNPSKGYDAVARHCVAAVLNACTSPPLTPATILGVSYAKMIWSSYATKGYFEPTAGIRWSAAQIVEWMSTTYL